jgi:U32 family peptidase
MIPCYNDYKIEVGSDVEIMGKNTNQDFVQNIGEMFNQDMESIKEAHPGQRIFLIPERPVEKYFMIRERVQD